MVRSFDAPHAGYPAQKRFQDVANSDGSICSAKNVNSGLPADMNFWNPPSRQSCLELTAPKKSGGAIAPPERFPMISNYVSSVSSSPSSSSSSGSQLLPTQPTVSGFTVTVPEGMVSTL